LIIYQPLSAGTLARARLFRAGLDPGSGLEFGLVPDLPLAPLITPQCNTGKLCRLGIFSMTSSAISGRSFASTIVVDPKFRKRLAPFCKASGKVCENIANRFPTINLHGQLDQPIKPNIKKAQPP
jgi:hypothetical protein